MSRITIAKGQSTSFSLTVERGDTPVFLTGDASVRFVATRSSADPDSAAIITKSIGDGIAVVDAASGQAELLFDPEDTAGLTVLERLLFYRLVLDVGLGDEVIDSGTLQIAIEEEENLYVGLEEVRAAGIPETFTDEQILAETRTWQSFIERTCRQWFYPREMSFYFESKNSTLVHFGVPIIAIHELKLHGATQPLDVSAYTIEGADSTVDGRQNPCIRLLGAQSHSIYATPYRPPLLIERGRHFVHGIFGYIEPDGMAPPLIRRALLKLVVEKLARPVYSAAGTYMTPPPLMQGALREEWTDDHRMKFDPSGGPLKSRAPGLAGITDDQEILGILRLYKAPIGIATLTSGVLGRRW